jgi:hypothetical protein
MPKTHHTTAIIVTLPESRTKGLVKNELTFTKPDDKKNETQFYC